MPARTRQAKPPAGKDWPFARQTKVAARSGLGAGSTALNYALSGMVDWRLAAEFIIGGIGGGLIGMLAATRLALYNNVLNRIFAALIFVVAGYVLYRSIGEIALR